MDAQISRRIPERFLYWGLAIVSLLVPILIIAVGHITLTWAFIFIFPVMIVIMYPTWRLGLLAMMFVNVLEYAMKYLLSSEDPQPQMGLFIMNSVSDNFIFIVVLALILHSKKISKRLAESEDRYRTIIETSPNGLVIHQDDTVLYANPSALTCVKEDDVGKSIFSYIHPDYHELSRQRLSEASMNNQLAIIEIQLIRSDGEIFDAEVTSSNINYGGSEAMLTIFRDVTDKKNAERILEESEKRYRGLVELSPQGILVLTSGVIEYANQACLKLLGASSLGELEGTHILDYTLPESVNVVKERIRDLNEVGVSCPPVEERMIRLDGTMVDVEFTGIPIKYNGNSAYLMMIQDLTKRKQDELVLRRSEEQYRLIADNMHDLVSVLDAQGVVKYASPSYETVLGFPSQVYEDARILDMIHSDDIPSVRSEFMNMIATKDYRVIEFRYKHRHGDWVPVEAKWTPVFDDDGVLLHFLVVARDITERKMYETKLNNLAYYDPLTGLPNRTLFNERFKQSLAEVMRCRGKMAVMYIDMDKFKQVNDTLGHDVGDNLLKHFANRVVGCLRDSDTVARQGGDEFTVLLPEIQHERDVLHVANRILHALQEPWNVGGHVLDLTSSIGIALYPKDGVTRRELLKHADQALYEAKKCGRNSFKTYSVLPDDAQSV